MRSSFALLILAPLTLATAAHAERHYDCTKAGNANKAVCKSAAVAMVPTAAKAATPKAAIAAAPPAQMAAAPVPAAVVKADRQYDCTKLGNRFKKVCRDAAKTATVAASPSPMVAPATVVRQAPMAAPATVQTTTASGSPRIVAWTEKNGKVVHYDCSKSGNFSKKACKG